MTHEISIELPGNQYGEVIVIEEYQGVYGLVLSKKGDKGGTVFKKWCFPEFKKEPGKKAVPWKLPLGNRDDAVKVIRALAAAFGIGAPVGQGTAPQVSDDDDDGIPF